MLQPRLLSMLNAPINKLNVTFDRHLSWTVDHGETLVSLRVRNKV